ncbi:hypothetical protein [Salinimicrobium sp. GXAS 041]|uniref:hypothetical protein n=1 Tax=Salinimicrobium sp. GXAS 041 TaxID=3400806 RepID=UPI003C70A998
MEKKKKKDNVLPIKDAFKVLGYIFAAILISACSGTHQFPTSEVLPAAEAKVDINQNENRNYEIELEVENIARPDRLTPSRNNYVVWMETKDHGVVNLGNLRINSKNKASLETVTPYIPLRIFITAENGRNVMRPSTQVVLNSGNLNID